MSTVGVSANRLEILQIAKAVAEEKSIDQRKLTLLHNTKVEILVHRGCRNKQ